MLKRKHMETPPSTEKVDVTKFEWLVTQGAGFYHVWPVEALAKENGRAKETIAAFKEEADANVFARAMAGIL
jgi:hypothetical protein